MFKASASGYANFRTVRSFIIDKYLNDGQPDSAVRSSNENEFLDYQYSIDDLDQFSGFVIKIVMNGTNEAFTPKLRDLRVVALA